MPAPALASAAASTLLNNDSSSSSSASSEAGGDDDEHMGVPAIVVDRPSEDEDRQPDPKTEDLLQVSPLFSNANFNFKCTKCHRTFDKLALKKLDEVTRLYNICQY